MIVYLVTNRANGKRYVGLTESDLDVRWELHVRASRCKKSVAYQKMPIVRAIAKYGPENFTQSVLETCESVEAMKLAEQRWIRELGTTDPKVGYNVSLGGDGAMRGRKHSKKALARMRASQAKANADPEVRKRKSVGAKLRNETMFTPEVRAKISEANSGENNAFYGKRFGRSANPTPHTEETKRKMSETHTGKVLSAEHRAAIARGVAGIVSNPRGQNRRPVHVYENDVHVASFLSLEFVAEMVNVSVKTLRRWLSEGRTFGARRYVQDESTISALRSRVR